MPDDRERRSVQTKSRRSASSETWSSDEEDVKVAVRVGRTTSLNTHGEIVHDSSMCGLPAMREMRKSKGTRLKQRLWRKSLDSDQLTSPVGSRRSSGSWNLTGDQPATRKKRRPARTASSEHTMSFVAFTSPQNSSGSDSDNEHRKVARLASEPSGSEAAWDALENEMPISSQKVTATLDGDEDGRGASTSRMASINSLKPPKQRVRGSTPRTSKARGPAGALNLDLSAVDPTPPEDFETSSDEEDDPVAAAGAKAKKKASRSGFLSSRGLDSIQIRKKSTATMASSSPVVRARTSSGSTPASGSFNEDDCLDADHWMLLDQEALDKHEAKRKNVITELVMTERKFVSVLSAINNVVLRPLEESDVLSKKERDLIFANTKDILKLNSSLLCGLENITHGSVPPPPHELTVPNSASVMGLSRIPLESLDVPVKAPRRSTSAGHSPGRAESEESPSQGGDSAPALRSMSPDTVTVASPLSRTISPPKRVQLSDGTSEPKRKGSLNDGEGRFKQGSPLLSTNRSPPSPVISQPSPAVVPSLMLDVCSSSAEVREVDVNVANLGELFLDYSTKMGICTEFCSNHSKLLVEKRLKTIREENQPFARFLQTCLLRPEVRGQTLEAMLITVPQRVCRYPMLLQELLKNTPPTHPEHEPLVSAWKSVRVVVAEINAQTEVASDFGALLDIQQVLQVPSSLNLTLLEDHRKFITRGWMKVPKLASYAFLFNDCLVLSRQKGDSFKATKVIQLSALILRTTGPSGQPIKAGVHSVQLAEVGENILTGEFDSELEMMQWTKHLTSAISNVGSLKMPIHGKRNSTTHSLASTLNTLVSPRGTKVDTKIRKDKRPKSSRNKTRTLPRNAAISLYSSDLKASDKELLPHELEREKKKRKEAEAKVKELEVELRKVKKLLAEKSMLVNTLQCRLERPRFGSPADTTTKKRKGFSKTISSSNLLSDFSTALSEASPKKMRNKRKVSVTEEVEASPSEEEVLQVERSVSFPVQAEPAVKFSGEVESPEQASKPEPSLSDRPVLPARRRSVKLEFGDLEEEKKIVAQERVEQEKLESSILQAKVQAEAVQEKKKKKKKMRIASSTDLFKFAKGSSGSPQKR